MVGTSRRLTVAVVAVLVASAGGIALVAGTGSLQQSDEQASFEVTEFDAPNITEASSAVTVSATVANPNDEAETQVVKYRFEGVVLAQEFVSLGPGESTTVTFTADLTGLSADTYVHGIFARDTGAVDAITIPASFEVSALNATSEAAVGEPVTVSATVTNPNEVASTQEVEVRFNGEVLDRETIELGAGESTNVTFEVETNGIAPGEYFGSILTRGDGELFAVTLTERTGEQPDASVTIENQSSDGTTVVIDSVTVSEGGFVAIHDASLLDGNVAGSVIGISEYLEPGTYEDLTIELFEVPGGEFNQTELEDGQLLIAMPHFDTGDNEQYDFVRTGGTYDGPYVANGSAVIDTATVSVGAEPPTETPGNETETPEEPGNETDTPEEPGNETDTPVDGTDTPVDGTDTPDEPGNVTDTPDEPGNVTDTPDEPGNATDTPGEPGNATDTPEEPGNETDTPVDGTDPPANETETPAAGTDTPVDGTDTPAAGTDTPANGTDGGAPPTTDGEESESIMTSALPALLVAALSILAGRAVDL